MLLQVIWLALALLSLGMSLALQGRFGPLKEGVNRKAFRVGFGTVGFLIALGAFALMGFGLVPTPPMLVSTFGLVCMLIGGVLNLALAILILFESAENEEAEPTR